VRVRCRQHAKARGRSQSCRGCRCLQAAEFQIGSTDNIEGYEPGWELQHVELSAIDAACTAQESVTRVPRLFAPLPREVLAHSLTARGAQALQTSVGDPAEPKAPLLGALAMAAGSAAI
jgi:hypothetical protein